MAGISAFVIQPGYQKLSYDLSGPQDGPIILLSNSLMCNYSSWDHFAAELVSKGFRVLRYDQIGHGHSSPPKDPSTTTFLTLSNDVKFLLKQLKIDKLHAWVGVSMGAATGIYFVTQNPGIVQKLVIVDTISSSPSNAGVPDLFGPRAEIARTESDAIAKLAAGTLERWFTAKWREANPAETERMRNLMHTTSKDGFIACCNALSDSSFDLRPLFKAVGHSVESTLLVVGELDANLPNTMETMRQEIQVGFGDKVQVRLVVIKDAGHVPFIDGWEDFDREIMPYLSNRSAGKI